MCSILGGYVAAWLAKHDELLNGALSAWLCIAFGIAAFGASVRGGTPVWEVILGELASPALGLLGGYFRAAQKRKRMVHLAGAIAAIRSTGV